MRCRISRDNRNKWLRIFTVNFGENEISYLKTNYIDKPVYTLIYRTEQVFNEVYLYCYPLNTEVFETEEAAQAKADKLISM